MSMRVGRLEHLLAERSLGLFVRRLHLLGNLQAEHTARLRTERAGEKVCLCVGERQGGQAWEMGGEQHRKSLIGTPRQERKQSKGESKARQKQPARAGENVCGNAREKREKARKTFEHPLEQRISAWFAPASSLRRCSLRPPQHSAEPLPRPLPAALAALSALSDDGDGDGDGGDDDDDKERTASKHVSVAEKEKERNKRQRQTKHTYASVQQVDLRQT
eukprot:2761857-Rhodomonas_salina.1